MEIDSSQVSPKLFVPRLSDADVSLGNLCRVGAVSDLTYRVDLLAKLLSAHPELTIEYLSADDNIARQFREKQCDVLLINAEEIDERTLRKTVGVMKLQMSQMPLLIAIYDHPKKIIGFLTSEFRDTLVVHNLFVDTVGKAEQIRRWLLSRLLYGDVLYNKLYDCVNLFFKQLDEKGNEYDVLARAVIFIMVHPYVYFPSVKELCAGLEEVCGQENKKIAMTLRSEYRTFIKNVPEEMLMRYFNVGSSQEERKISEMTLIYKTAEMLSEQCRRIVSVMRSGFYRR